MWIWCVLRYLILLLVGLVLGEWECLVEFVEYECVVDLWWVGDYCVVEFVV